MNHRMSSRKNSELKTLSYLEGLLFASLRLTKNGHQAVRLTHEAICRLPLEFRIVFILSYLEGFTHKEIANLAGSKPEAVASMLNRGLELIEKKSAKYVPDGKVHDVTIEEVLGSGTGEKRFNSEPSHSHACGRIACCEEHHGSRDSSHKLFHG